ncbi:MAG: exodeoxyribonuclease III [Pseudomonadota bacterium]|nr:MAG: exodeoxyribonuclease III [Pseudomonadota bacterium]
MIIATWNVNSIRVRLPQVLDWLAQHKPDILCLQETKVIDSDFPQADFAAFGYQAALNGQKTYNGVAILSRTAASALQTELPMLDTEQRRLLAATINGTRVVNVYVPNGESVESDKYQFKLKWLRALRSYLAQELATHRQLVLLGDFNIAPEPRDVYDPKTWEGHVLFSEPERAALRGLAETGLVDVFRAFPQPDASYTWWDYRQGGFRRNHGLRIDHILVSAPLAAYCRRCIIDKEPRGLERPSDHAPVVATFD